jgi:hypothetical protein
MADKYISYLRRMLEEIEDKSLLQERAHATDDDELFRVLVSVHAGAVAYPEGCRDLASRDPDVIADWHEQEVHLCVEWSAEEALRLEKRMAAVRAKAIAEGVWKPEWDPPN